MDRLIYIVNQIDEELKAFYVKDSVFYGLCRQETKGSERMPLYYKGNGDYDFVGFKDNSALQFYHRQTGFTPSIDQSGGFGTNLLKEETYTMTMIVYGSQKKVNNANIDINYRIGDEVQGLIPSVLSSSQLTAIDAQSTLIRVSSVEFDKRSVFDLELPDTEYKIKPDAILFSVNYTISLKYLQDCKTNSCTNGVAEDEDCIEVSGIDGGSPSSIYSNSLITPEV